MILLIGNGRERMRLIGILGIVALTSCAAADERTPWKEPPLGPLSPIGTTIEVETMLIRLTHTNAETY
jgi:hypothetical protein